MNIQILGDRVLLTELAQIRESTLTIISDNKGVLTGKAVKIGDTVTKVKEENNVLYKEEDTYPITFEGKKLLVIREYDIIAII